MGYSPEQIADLASTINAADYDLVLVATPIDLRRLIRIHRPALRVSYELKEVGSPTLEDVLAPHTQRLPSSLGVPSSELVWCQGGFSKEVDE